MGVSILRSAQDQRRPHAAAQQPSLARGTLCRARPNQSVCAFICVACDSSVGCNHAGGRREAKRDGVNSVLLWVPSQGTLEYAHSLLLSTHTGYDGYSVWAVGGRKLNALGEALRIVARSRPKVGRTYLYTGCNRAAACNLAAASTVRHQCAGTGQCRTQPLRSRTAAGAPLVEESVLPRVTHQRQHHACRTAAPPSLVGGRRRRWPTERAAPLSGR